MAPQNDASAAKLFEKLKHETPQGIAPLGYDAFAEMTRMPPFWWAVNSLKMYPHTARLYGSLDDRGRTALLEGRLSASALGSAQLTEATSLLPLLPHAIQQSPNDSVMLRLPYSQQATNRIIFGAVPPIGLEVVTPPPAPPSAP